LRDPVIHDDFQNAPEFIMDYRVSSRQRLASLARRDGPVMTRDWD
jgi:hypothetical protein